MKGRKLSLDEVLKLEDGIKVWVEELNPRYSDWSGIHKRVLDELIAEKDEMIYEIRYLDGLGGDYGIEIYEWVEDELKIPDKIETPYYLYDIIKDMATEICNLRGIDLTEDNIDKITKEFTEEE